MYVALARLPSWTVVVPAVLGAGAVTFASSRQHSSAELLLVSVTIAVVKNASVAEQIAAKCTRATASTAGSSNMTLRVESKTRGGVGTSGGEEEHEVYIPTGLYPIANEMPVRY